MSKCLTALAVVLLLAAPAAMAQAPSSSPTEVIVRGAVRPKPTPDIPPPPLEVFTQSPRIEQIAVSDDGSRFAFVTRKGGQSTVWVKTIKLTILG